MGPASIRGVAVVTVTSEMPELSTISLSFCDHRVDLRLTLLSKNRSWSGSGLCVWCLLGTQFQTLKINVTWLNLEALDSGCLSLVSVTTTPNCVLNTKLMLILTQ